MDFIDLDADVYREPVGVTWRDANGDRQTIVVNPNRYSTEDEIRFGTYTRKRAALLADGKVEEAEQLFVEKVAECVASDNPAWTAERLATVPSKVLGKVLLFFVSPDSIPPPSSVPADVTSRSPSDQSRTHLTPAQGADQGDPLPNVA